MKFNLKKMQPAPSSRVANLKSENEKKQVFIFFRIWKKISLKRIKSIEIWGREKKQWIHSWLALSLTELRYKLQRIRVLTWGLPSRRLSKLWFLSWVDAQYWKPIILYTWFSILSPTRVCPITLFFTHAYIFTRA